MSTSAIGDLAQSFLLQKRNVTLKQDIARLTEELSTGQTADVRDVLVGNYSFLTDVERKTELLSGYSVASSEATQFTTAMQLALENFAGQFEPLTNTLLNAGSGLSGIGPNELATEAQSTFDAMVDTLNISSAGRQLFSGQTTNQPPMADSADILADLSAAIAGAATPTDMMTQATAWFDDPGGFAASAYQGSANPMASFTLSDTESVTLDLRGNDPAFFAAFRGAALAAISTEPAFGLSQPQQLELFSLSGEQLLQGQNDVVSLRGRVGFAEARIDNITSRNAAELTSLHMARNALLEVDPFEAATKLEEAQFQLQSLYSVTVRMSQLSLVNYL